MIRTLVRMLPRRLRRLKDRVKHSITKLVPPERSDSFGMPRLSWGRITGIMLLSTAGGSPFR
jgi:hypothetical protein